MITLYEEHDVVIITDIVVIYKDFIGKILDKSEESKVGMIRILRNKLKEDGRSASAIQCKLAIEAIERNS